jgi:hypothetical protein
MLGSYQDATTAALVPKAGLEDTLAAAFQEYGQNVRYPRPMAWSRDLTASW